MSVLFETSIGDIIFDLDGESGRLLFSGWPNG